MLNGPSINRIQTLHCWATSLRTCVIIDNILLTRTIVLVARTIIVVLNSIAHVVLLKATAGMSIGRHLFEIVSRQGRLHRGQLLNYVDQLVLYF